MLHMVSMSQKRWKPDLQTGGRDMVQVKLQEEVETRMWKMGMLVSIQVLHGIGSGYFRPMVMLWKYFCLCYSHVRLKNGLAFSVAVAVLFIKKWLVQSSTTNFVSAGAR